MSEEQRDPSEQALRDHADMIEASCKETPQLRRRIERLRTAADRIAELEGEVERLRNLLSQTYPYIGWGPAPDGLADKVWEETKHIKEATDGK